MMRRLFLLIAVLFVAAMPAMAQDSYPRAEIFGGYCYVNSDGNLNGFGVSVAGNFHKNVGLVGEFGGHFGHQDFQAGDFNGEVNADVYSYLFGPRFSHRGESATVFAHALFGGAHVKIDGRAAIPGGTIEVSGSDNGFAMAIGGGVDVNAGKSVAFRLFQADYAPTRFSGEWNHNFRLQIGIVFKAGGQ